MNDMTLQEEYEAQPRSFTKKSVVEDIIKGYVHDYDAEGHHISKRRLWYILKPLLMAAKVPVSKRGTEYARTKISNKDYNKFYNDLADAGEIDDSYILDSSRDMEVGELLPHIIIAPEKATVATTAKILAESLGCSYYISGGDSAVYGAKKLSELIDQPRLEVVSMTDLDKRGLEIDEGLGKHFGVVTHRALLDLHQVPPSKVNDYYEITSDGTKYYELDILNIHELQEVFLAGVPSHIRTEIIEAHERRTLVAVKEYELNKAVSEDTKIAKLRAKIERLEIKLSRKYWKLYQEYAEVYDEEAPTTVHPFDLDDIMTNSIDYTTEVWL